VLRHSAARFQLYHVIGDFNYMSHVTVNESGRTYGWVMTLIWMSHITLMSTPAADSAVVRCEKSTARVMSRWMSHVMYECVMSHSCRHQALLLRTTPKLPMYESCHGWIRLNESYVNESCHMTHSPVTLSHVRLTWMTHSLTWMSLTWMSHVICECVMSHSCRRHVHRASSVTV